MDKRTVLEIREAKERIDTINKYNEVKAVEAAPVITKSYIGEISTIKYLVLPLRPKIAEELKEAKSFEEEYIKDSLEKLGLLEEVRNDSNDKELLFIGDLSLYQGYEKLVYKFPQRKKEELQGVPAHYRYYIFLRERQLRNMHLINICPSAIDSWKSVITKIGSKYGVIIKLKINKPLIEHGKTL